MCVAGRRRALRSSAQGDRAPAAEAAGLDAPCPLIAQLELGEARLRLVAASNDKAYERVIDEGAAHPQLLVCDEMDILWRVAEAFAKTGREPRSQDTYRYILTSCDAAKERLATMQKAAQLLQPPRSSIC